MRTRTNILSDHDRSRTVQVREKKYSNWRTALFPEQNERDRLDIGNNDRHRVGLDLLVLILDRSSGGGTTTRLRQSPLGFLGCVGVAACEMGFGEADLTEVADLVGADLADLDDVADLAEGSKR